MAFRKGVGGSGQKEGMYIAVMIALGDKNGQINAAARANVIPDSFVA